MKHLALIALSWISVVGLAQAAVDSPRSDPASIQRGAALYMDYCASCHSLKYVRYDQLARDIGLPRAQVHSLQAATQSQSSSPIKAQLSPELTLQMFGRVPPDLSLVTSARSPDWVARYLQGFYPDTTRPSGVNNHIYPHTAMPDVLAPLRQQVGDQAFAAKVGDLVNFLQYSADPSAATRKRYGVFVLLFLTLLLLPVYLLHREYRKDNR